MHSCLPFWYPGSFPSLVQKLVQITKATLQRINATCFPLAFIYSSPHRSVVWQGKITLSFPCSIAHTTCCYRGGDRTRGENGALRTGPERSEGHSKQLCFLSKRLFGLEFISKLVAFPLAHHVSIRHAHPTSCWELAFPCHSTTLEAHWCSLWDSHRSL